MMGEIIKNEDGTYDLPKIFMGLAMAVLVIMQQYQTMHIAEIRTMAEVNKVNFMDKQEVIDRVAAAENKHAELEERIQALEDKCNANK